MYAYAYKGKRCIKDEMSFQFCLSGYALVVNHKPGDVSLCVCVCVCVFLNLCEYTYETFETLKKRVRAGRC